MGCRGGVGVAGLWRGGDRLGRGGGLGAEGWGGGAGCGGGAGRGGVCGVGGGDAVSAFRVGCAGVGGCCVAVLYGICCRDCVGAAFGLARVAARGVMSRKLV